MSLCFSRSVTFWEFDAMRNNFLSSSILVLDIYEFILYFISVYYTFIAINFCVSIAIILVFIIVYSF